MLLKFHATGVTMHVENSQARAFLAAGLAEEIKNSAAAPDTAPRWSVELLFADNGYPTVAVVLKIGNGRIHYTGKPEDINRRVEWEPGKGRYDSGFGRECPADIVRTYTEAWQAKPEYRAEIVAHMRALNHCD